MMNGGKLSTYQQISYTAFIGVHSAMHHMHPANVINYHVCMRLVCTVCVLYVCVCMHTLM